MVIYEVFFNLVDVIQSGNNQAVEVVAGFVRDDILEIIALIPWAESFAKFS